MPSKPKAVASEKKKTQPVENKKVEYLSHAVTRKVQTAEGWKRAALKDSKKRKVV
jgi:hypothetical protein